MKNPKISNKGLNQLGERATTGGIKKQRTRSKKDQLINKVKLAQKVKNVSKNILDLSELSSMLTSESLKNTDTQQKKIIPGKSKKTKRNSEIKRFSQIIKLSEFKNNPLHAIQLHLKNSNPKSD